MDFTSERFRLLTGPEERRGVFVATARDRLLGVVCHLKVARLEAKVAEIEAEAGLLAELRHPHLVPLVGRLQGELAGLSGGPVAGLATLWIDGEPFGVACQGLPMSARLAHLARLLQAVAYMHQRRVLHLDIKPQNVLISAERGPVLLDLGSALLADSGPGESGGTLGYAAPEVLAGHAPSFAADIYSLGALFYETLTGRRPHGELEGDALHRACVGGDIVPLRLVEPSIPPKLALLVEDMLALQPSQRPRSVGVVLERLAAQGVPIPRCALGAPPFVGRERESALLRRLLQENPGAAVAVIGPRGAGRSALIRRLAAEEGSRFLDLGQARDPGAALQRLMGLAVPSLPACGTPAFLPALRNQRVSGDLGLLAFLGRIEDMEAADRAALLEHLPIFGLWGVRVLLAAEGAPPGCLMLPLGPLSGPDLERIGQFAGLHAGVELREAVEESQGNPERFLERLEGSPDPASLPAALRSVLEALATLPRGIPATVLAALPAALQAQVAELQLIGFAWLDRDRMLRVEGGAAPGTVHPLLRAVVEPLVLDPSCELPPIWRALAAARLGRADVVRRYLGAAASEAGRRPRALDELLGYLVEQGDSSAVIALARHRLGRGEVARSLDALSAGGARGPEAMEIRARALRLLGGLDASEELVRLGLGEHPDHAGLWLEHAIVLARRDAIAEALDAVRKAETLAPELAFGEGLSLRLMILARQQALGLPVDEPWATLERVEKLPVGRTLPATALQQAGRVLVHLGEDERALALLAKASQAADREGDLRLAAAIRLNHGVALIRVDRSRAARPVLYEATLIARAMGLDELLMRLTFTLAFLELRAERLPAAEALAAEFREVSERLNDAGARQRGLLLDAQLCAVRGEHERVVAMLLSMDCAGLPTEILSERSVALARAQIELGRAEEALQTLEGTRPRTPSEQREVRVLRGRAHLSLGRAELRVARASIGETFDPNDRLEVAETLLSFAGEDLDPGSFRARRADLDRAVRILRGSRAQRAATLHDRLLDGPGAALERVAELIEAMATPKALPVALARLVTEALGANRVLIMLRMPGLGQQVTYKELAGEEAAGIGKEVMRRITGPEDVWLARDAFADPALREASATVRTFEIKSLLAVAIPSGQRAIGALYVDDLNRPDRFGPEEVRVLQRLAAAAGRMIPLLPSANTRGRSLIEPRDILGVMLADPAHVDAMNDALTVLRRQSETNLLVSGPTGVGKTWFARRLATEVLGLDGLIEVVVNNNDRQFLVSRLGGTRRGEYTGAFETVGAIRQAIRERKALFIDEVQDLGDQGQQTLLPLLELPVRRFGGLLGATDRVAGPLHVILGTNVDVSGKRWSEHFRSDLWYRMSDVHVALPRLAERGPEVIYRYLAQMLAELQVGPPEEVFDGDALDRVTSGSWTGNLRALQSFAKRAVALHQRDREGPLSVASLHRLRMDDEDDEAAAPPADARMVARERDLVIDALKKAGFVQAEAARILGITRWTMLRLVRKHQLEDLIRGARK